VNYFDHNATTPLSPVAREAWLRAQDEAWVNPSGPYRDAARVRLRLEGARIALGALMGAAPDRVVFVSGATEAANVVAVHLARTLPADAWVAINPTEHPCVIAAFAAAFGGRRVELPVSESGLIDPDSVQAVLERPESEGKVRVVVVMAANNETGVVQPWTALARVCRSRGIELVCDASQWLGKLPAAGLGVADWLLASGHKFGAPKGVGFLLRGPQADGFHGQLGGEQQRGHRGGTEDYPGVAAMLAALAEAEQSKVLWESARVADRDEFERSLQRALPGAVVVGRGVERLWNTVAVTLPRHENQRWVARMDKRGFAISTGSACASGKEGPSHVLAAMGIEPERMRRVVRLSSGWDTSASDWNDLLQAMVEVGAELDRGA